MKYKDVSTGATENTQNVSNFRGNFPPGLCSIVFDFGVM